MTRQRILAAAIPSAVALVVLGRVTAPPSAARARGYHDGSVGGYADGIPARRAQRLQGGQAPAGAPAPPAAARARGYHDGSVAGYAAGFRAGRAEGLQEGQALAETAALP